MISFLSFGDSRLEPSLKRIKEQAEQFGVFNEINVLCEYDLPQDFKEKHKDKLILSSRGYGYWIWKPYLILQHLKKMQNGDFLVYADCGSHINPYGHKIFGDYLDIAGSNNTGILAFSLAERGFFEYQWTKADLLNHFGVYTNRDVVLSPQIEGGTLFIMKNSESVNFIEKWYGVFEYDFNLINDTPSKLPNYHGFIEHRHDQSCFSILGKLNKIATLDCCGNNFPTPSPRGGWLNWRELALKGCPIIAARDKQMKNEASENMTDKKEELLNKVAAMPFWYHKIQLPYGIITPGWAPIDPEAYKIPESLKGKRVLDVGSWDGYWSFEALKRGASEVVAIDDFSDYMGSLDKRDRKTWETFDLCRSALGYSEDACRRIEMSIYDVSEDRLGIFDVVFFFGTLYHLRYPLLALDKISAICKEEIYVESAILDDFSPYQGGMGHGYSGQQMVMEFYPGKEYGNNETNWWAPTLLCMMNMVKASGFVNVEGWKFADPSDLAFCRGFAKGKK